MHMTPPVGANAISTPNTTTKLEITKTIGRKPRRYRKYTEAQSRPINHTRGTYVLTVRICYVRIRGSPEHNETMLLRTASPGAIGLGPK